jgi:aspartate carbamoyltransferase regulatory subunit
MALILTLLKMAERGETTPPVEEVCAKGLRCRNPKCITAAEEQLRQRFKRAEGDTLRCVYCETKAE